MKNVSSISTVVFFLILAGGFALECFLYGQNPQGLWVLGVFFLIALSLSSSIKIANQWDRAIVLRLGKFHALKGPGVFFIVPLVDKITSWIDKRTITTSFKAEKTLTKDTVPVDVDAVLF